MLFCKVQSNPEVIISGKTSPHVAVILISVNEHLLENTEDLNLLAAFYKGNMYIEILDLIREYKFKNILIVDDAPIVRKLLIRAIEKAKRDVFITEAKDSYEAFRYIRRAVYDLIITDYLHPGLDGREMIEAIRRGEF